MIIKTDHKWKDFLYSYQLTEKEILELDHLTRDEIDSRSFIRYKGQIYHMGDFMRVPDGVEGLLGWHGYSSDSFFSGIVIKVSDDGDQYMIGGYYQ